ncbi:MAG: deoxyribodipyrimidine photo-lyase [Gammaproteobacteria bacterium]
MTRLVWFRNDLRVADNPALFEACETGEPVVAVFLVSDGQWREHGLGRPRLAFLKATLTRLADDLTALGIPLWIERAPRFRDAPGAIVRIAQTLDATCVTFNAEYPLDEARRDDAVVAACRASGIECRAGHGDVILPPGLVAKDDGSPYAVFSAFKRRWQQTVTAGDLSPLPSPQRIASSCTEPMPDPRPALDAMPAPDADPEWPAGEGAALARLDEFLTRRIEAYADERDYPDKAATSRLSAYLSVGAISGRTCFHRARLGGAGPGVDAWLNELIWREFYRHVVAAFPRVSRGRAFKAEMDDLQWRDDATALDAWKSGRTGYPLVDAGMRQLARTGFMHNRLRMLTAMFLTKHLLIDWREGERHFMAHLRDADFPSNNGGWQWSASTGTDAVPYFRIFNPTSQAKKFDPNGSFVRKWVPELADGGSSYPPPIVDHARARARALDFFRTRR